MNDSSGETPAPSPEPVRLPERFRTENQMTAVHTRFALDRDALNPQKKDLPETAENQLTNLNETVTKAGTASTMERQNINYSKDRWAEMMVEGFAKKGNAKLVQKIGEHKIGGLDFSHATKETFLTAYQKYFADDGQGTQVEVIIKDEKQYIPARLNQFVEDILSAYPNKAELKADLATIEWFAGVFGEESKKIIRSILETKLILDKPEEKTNLVKDANEKASKNGTETSRVNWVEGNNKEEERQLTFLWGNSHDVERRMVDRRVGIPPTPPEPTPPHPSPAPTPEPPGKEQTPLPDRPQSLEDMFAHVVGPVNENHQWFIKGKPQQIEIAQDTVDQYISKTGNPFFIIEKFDPVTKGFNFLTNKEVVPYAWDLGKGLPHENLRFINGEATTDGDSSLFGLAAASGDSPQNQAELYKLLSGNILQIHKMYPDVLAAWLNNQTQAQDGNISSLSLFIQNDHIIKPNQQPELRPENERLLPYSKPLDLKLKTPEDGANFLKMWDNRIVELNVALQNNKLQPYHLRWIEFLSHSVDVAEMMKTIKAEEQKDDFEIKIIEQPKDIKDLIQVIDAQSDKPIIINIEKPYE